MLTFKKQNTTYSLICAVIILALLYVVEQNAILGDEEFLFKEKTLIKELSLSNQEILKGATLIQLEKRLESAGDVLRLERIKEFSFLEPSSSEFSLTPKRYE